MAESRAGWEIIAPASFCVRPRFVWAEVGTWYMGNYSEKTEKFCPKWQKLGCVCVCGDPDLLLPEDSVYIRDVWGRKKASGKLLG